MFISTSIRSMQYDYCNLDNHSGVVDVLNNSGSVSVICTIYRITEWNVQFTHKKVSPPGVTR